MAGGHPGQQLSHQVGGDQRSIAADGDQCVDLQAAQRPADASKLGGAFWIAETPGIANLFARVLPCRTQEHPLAVAGTSKQLGGIDE
jgi:hypothetical protein